VPPGSAASAALAGCVAVMMTRPARADTRQPSAELHHVPSCSAGLPCDGGSPLSSHTVARSVAHDLKLITPCRLVLIDAGRAGAVARVSASPLMPLRTASIRRPRRGCLATSPSVHVYPSRLVSGRSRLSFHIGVLGSKGVSTGSRLPRRSRKQEAGSDRRTPIIASSSPRSKPTRISVNFDQLRRSQGVRPRR
jgi:hypothetical protein